MVVVAMTMALAGRAAGPGGAPGGTPEGPAPAVRVGGRSVPYRQAEAWTVASATSRDTRALSVFAVGYDEAEGEGGSACGPPVLRFRVRETARRITITADGYEDRPKPMTLCAAIGYVPWPHRVALKDPVGDRRVVDGGTGRRARLLVASEWPDIPRPPRGFVAGVLGASWSAPGVARTWRNGDAAIDLQVVPPRATREIGPSGRVVQHPVIRRTTATVYAGDGQLRVQWTPNGAQTITVTLTDGPGRRWTTGQAVAVARSVTGARTADTGRLPQPAVRGDVQAVFNGADGPLRRSEQMLKSSRVLAAFDCRGRGTATVMLGTATHRIACGVATRSRVLLRTGPPNEPFAVGVRADPGVRWAMTLARQTTDGT